MIKKSTRNIFTAIASGIMIVKRKATKTYVPFFILVSVFGMDSVSTGLPSSSEAAPVPP
jgi:hypothetical protein